METLTTQPGAQKVVFLYLANDVVQKGRKRGKEIPLAFANVMPKVVESVVAGCTGDEMKRVVRTMKIWADRAVFDAATVKSWTDTIEAAIARLPAPEAAKPAPAAAPAPAASGPPPALPASDVASAEAAAPRREPSISFAAIRAAQAAAAAQARPAAMDPRSRDPRLAPVAAKKKLEGEDGKLVDALTRAAELEKSGKALLSATGDDTSMATLLKAYASHLETEYAHREALVGALEAAVARHREVLGEKQEELSVRLPVFIPSRPSATNRDCVSFLCTQAAKRGLEAKDESAEAEAKDGGGDDGDDEAGEAEEPVAKKARTDEPVPGAAVATPQKWNAIPSTPPGRSTDPMLDTSPLLRSESAPSSDVAPGWKAV